MVIVIDRLFTITFYDRTSRMQRCKDVHIMHAPCIHLNRLRTCTSRTETTCVLRSTDPHIETTTYITASHPTRVAFRTSAPTTNTPAEAPREEQQHGCKRCRGARPAMPPYIRPPQCRAPPASPQPLGWSPQQVAHAWVSHLGRNGMPLCNAAPAAREHRAMARGSEV